MTDIVIVGAPKDLDLTDLNRWLSQNERTAAPVVAIGQGVGEGGDPQTAVSLDYDQEPLTANFATAKLKVGAAAVVASDEVLVCEGKAYISNALTAVFLVRKKT